MAVGTDLKGKLSPVFYLAGIISAWAIPDDDHVGAWVAMACFVAVAIMWIVPDRRIERVVRATRRPGLSAPPGPVSEADRPPGAGPRALPQIPGNDQGECVSP